jgi:hypothetical protein
METHRIAPTTTPLDPFAISAGLLKNDLRLLPALFALLALPSVAEVVLAPHTGATAALLIVIERLLQLTVMSVVVLRWRHRLTGSTPHRLRRTDLSAAGTIFGVGALLSLAYNGGLQLAVLTSAPTTPGQAAPNYLLLLLGLAGLCITGLGFILSARLYFYYAVAGILGGSWRAVVRGAWGTARRSRGAVFRALCAPCAWTALAVTVCSLPYPDGRSLFWGASASAMTGVFWLLSTYTGLGLALTLFHPAEWRAAGLEPYYPQRLETLAAQGRTPVGSALQPGAALKILSVTALTCMVVFYRFTTQPSSIQLEVLSVEIHDEAKGTRLEVRVRAADPEHHLRAFQPMLLSLRGENGLEVSKGPPLVVEATPQPESSAPLELTVSLSTDRTAEELRALTDLWVWYGFAKRVYVSPMLTRQLGDGKKEGELKG